MLALPRGTTVADELLSAAGAATEVEAPAMSRRSAAGPIRRALSIRGLRR